MSSAVHETFSTFRDPAGQLSLTDDHAVRIVRRDYADTAREFIVSPLYSRWAARGDIVGTEILSDDAHGMRLRHPRLFLASYPWEWTSQQWLAAAELTLQLSDEAIQDGWLLKDATPLNILFDGAKPVFVDVLSFERRDPANPIWLAQGQFVRSFLLPLIAHQYLGWPLGASMLARDGYEPQEIYRALPFLYRFHPRLLWPVTMPALLEKRADQASANQARKLQRSPEMATAVLRHGVRSLRHQVRRAAAANEESTWAHYNQTAAHYTAGEVEQKRSFIGRLLRERRPATVLDIGCNTGTYSRMAAEAGAKVISLDSDAAAVGRLWQESAQRKADILPLVGNIARPTPSVGWNNAESASLLDRLENKFDLVLMLAVVHHLLLSDQVPLDRISTLARRLTKKWLALEWVPASDPMFQKMLRGRDNLYGHLNEQHLVDAFSREFETLERHELTNGRVMFLFQAR